jgi:diguanylate cyclase (GGDEF)-like protein/PAS domain S-box-containing protein
MNEIETAAARFSLLDHAPIGQFVLREDGVTLFWNRCLEAWTGINREDLLGVNLLEHFPHLGANKYVQRIADLFHGGPPTIFSSQLHRHIIPAPLPGGKLRAQYTVATSIPGAVPGTWYALFAIQDVTSLTETIDNHRQALQRAMTEMEERRRAEAELVATTEELKRLNRIFKERSIRDGLTGLFNHHYFYKVLNRDFLLAARSGCDLACILLDLDYFKGINDSYGHPCGDQVLKKVAQVIRRTVRQTDIVARYGGEEFAVLLPATDLAGAEVTAEHIRAAIARQNFHLGESSLNVTASLGVASLCAHRPRTPQELLAAADQALYQAKDGGRNCSRAFASDASAATSLFNH